MPITDVTDGDARAGPRHVPRPHRGGRARARDRAARRRRRLRHAPAQDQRGAVAGPDRARRPRRAKRNLFTLKATDEAIGNLGKKGAREDVARRCSRRPAPASDDTLLVGVDQPGPLAMAMGILRLEMGRELKLVDEKAFRFLWVTDFPLFEHDAADRRCVSVQPPVHRAARRGRAAARQRPGSRAGQGLRPRPQRHRGGRRQHPYPRLRAAGEGLQGPVADRRGGAGALRLLPRGAPVRHAAPRRDRPGRGPHGHDPGRRVVASAT